MRTITPEGHVTKAAARANRLYDTLAKEGFSAHEIGLAGAAILERAGPGYLGSYPRRHEKLDRPMIPLGIDLGRLPRTAEQFWKLVALVGFAGFAFGHWWQGLLTIGAALICLWRLKEDV